MQIALDDVLQRITGQSPEKQKELAVAAFEGTKDMKWIPNPGPQTDAYFSKADILLFGGEPGGGKLLDINTTIPTPFGWSTMGDLSIGDQVFDESGAICNVVAKSEIETEGTYRITFSDGSKIVAGYRHQWVTSTRTDRMRELKCNDEWRAERQANRPKRGTGKRPDLALANSVRPKAEPLPTRGVRTTLEIANTLILPGNRINHAVDMAAPLQLPEAELLIDPYVMGAWLGDGSHKSGQITGLDEEIFKEVANAGYVVTQHACQKSRGILGIVTKFKQLGVYGNKHIPQQYLRSSIDQRLSLLQGLMDTDGHCDIRGQCEIQLTRKVLIDGVHELLSSLGIKAQMHEGVAKLNGRVTGPKWRLKFLTDLPAFRLPRKLIRQKRSGFRGTHDVRYIVSCERVDNVPMQCIEVDSKSHMYLCGEQMIPTHNSQLGLGLAFNCHERSLIMRRSYGDLGRLTEDAIKINGSDSGFNGSPPPRFKLSPEHIIDFAAANRVGDEQKLMGQGHDLIVFDEGTHFAEQQIRFLMGWLRTDTPNQRCRVLIATNPPLSAEGLWVIEMFAPWLNPQYPNPAKPGELRWVISDEDGKDMWVESNSPVVIAGKLMYPVSRTYIPSKVSDNPFYAATDYERQLDAMPEPYRSLLMGGFKTAFRDAPDQCIPTKWVQLAQERWTAKPPSDVPMCAMGVDASGGGEDPMIISPRYDGWYAPLIEIPGKEIPIEHAGASAGGHVITHRRDKALVTIDMGGGYGGPMYEHLSDNGVAVKAYKGAESSTRRSIDGKMTFTNTRSTAYWQFREALDPGQPGGSPIALPPDQKLLADLTAPTFTATSRGIQLEEKKKVCERLGRSTDRGDAAVMSWFHGPRMLTDALDWINAKERNTRNGHIPSVNSGNRRQPLSVRNRG